MLNPLERFFSLFTPLHAGEGRAVVLLLAKIYLLLLSYYLLKPVREALILSDGTAEIRSYAVAAQAALLLLIVPIYSAVFKRTQRTQLIRWVTLFLCANLFGFYALGRAEVSIAVPFFVWLGIFSVLIIAQFWAFVVDLYSVDSGQRLLVVIAVGASLGAWTGSLIAKALFAALGPYDLMLLALAGLLITVFLTQRAEASVPLHARNLSVRSQAEDLRGILGGFRLVARDHYLLLIALFVVLLNWINTTGEYILAKFVVQHAESLIAAGTTLNKGQIIGAFYGEFFAWVNALSLFIQLFLVSRVYRRVGVRGALLVMPLLALAGYSVVLALPVFVAVVAFKVLENSVDYSLQNTTRHALYLPTSREAKYAGKTAIETFFWRFGDLIQGGVVYVGAALLGLGVAAFAALNIVLAAAWLAVVNAIRHKHKLRIAHNLTQPPGPPT